MRRRVRWTWPRRARSTGSQHPSGDGPSRRHVPPSLVLVDREALAEQWREQTGKLLGIKTGQVGGRRKLTGVVDIAMLPTLARHDDVAELTDGYGHVLIDSVMYCQVLTELAHERGWAVHFYNAKDVEDEAVRLLGERAGEVLQGPRARWGPPWSKDHRMALAATIVTA